MPLAVSNDNEVSLSSISHQLLAREISLRNKTLLVVQLQSRPSITNLILFSCLPKIKSSSM